MSKAMTTRRRTAAGGLLATPAALFGAGGLRPQAAAPAPQSNGTAGHLEPGAGGWQTWVLASGSEVQPPPPPGEAAARAELAELRALAARRDAAALDEVAYWDAGAPGYRWNELATARGLPVFSGTRAYRMMALLNVAVHDATVATWAAKYRFNRPRPAVADPSLTTALPDPAEPRVPLRACRAAAGAAAAVLGYLFPDATDALAEQAAAAGRSRLVAGVPTPATSPPGSTWAGRSASGWWPGPGETARTPSGPAPSRRGPACGEGPTRSSPWRGPGGPGCSPPGDALRPPPPPAPDSAERAAEVEELRGYARDLRDTRRRPEGARTGWSDPAGRPAPGAQRPSASSSSSTTTRPSCTCSGCRS